jgi:acyl-CoA dehydrogenase
MAKVFHDVASRAVQIHGSLGVTDEMPLMEMVQSAFVMGLVDGPTEVHKVTVSRQVLRNYSPSPGVFPTMHTPLLRERARTKYADVLARHGR